MIYVECYNDYLLMKYFDLEFGIDFDHSFGKINVLNDLESSVKGLAIVDADPNNPNYTYQKEDYPVIERVGNLFLYKVPNDIDQYIIEIPDELESWLASIARHLRVNPSDYEIADRTGNFLKNLQKTNYLQDRFKAFLNIISEHEEMDALKRWIKEYGQG
jgi:hypothetical protein